MKLACSGTLVKLLRLLSRLMRLSLKCAGTKVFKKGAYGLELGLRVGLKLGLVRGFRVRVGPRAGASV